MLYISLCLFNAEFMSLYIFVYYKQESSSGKLICKRLWKIIILNRAILTWFFFNLPILLNLNFLYLHFPIKFDNDIEKNS